jgi:hypothetical protein
MTDEYLLTYPGVGQLRSVCHLLVNTDERWAIAGQVGDNPGTSVTNSIERVHGVVAARWFEGETDFVLFEYTPIDLVEQKPALYEIRWHDPPRFSMPEWVRSDRADRLLHDLRSRFPSPYVSETLKNAVSVVFGDIVAEPQPPVSRSLLIGTLPLPQDFPAKEFDSAELHFRARTGTSVISPAATWAEFSAAWVALAYRFVDVARSDEQFRTLLERYGPAPPLPERYAQESLLFTFFISGLAAIESLSYGLTAMAWEAGAPEFALETPEAKNAVSPDATAERLRRHFPDDVLTANLVRLMDSGEYQQWVETRNALAHRAAPPRHHVLAVGSIPNSQRDRESRWGSLVLDAELTAGRRRWLSGQLRGLLRDAGEFAARHFAEA